MSSCEHTCSTCNVEDCGKNKSHIAPTYEKNHIKKIIGVVSGKGGVGKSMVTSLLATSLAKKGYKVGILDSDITGPSIPKAFGVKDGVSGNGKIMNPSISKHLGIKVMSVNLFIKDPTQPVIWRGPVLNSAIRQFYSEVYWGDLDYLLIDMPPGTGDVALTVFQLIPVDGVIIVSTPQDLVKMIVGKAVHMCEQMKVNIVGLVENMSYMECPCCGNKLYPFGTSQLDTVSKEYNITPIMNLPINPSFTKDVDNGDVELIDTTFISKITSSVENFQPDYFKHFESNIANAKK